jgi:hypothetical protein
MNLIFRIFLSIVIVLYCFRIILFYFLNTAHRGLQLKKIRHSSGGMLEFPSTSAVKLKLVAINLKGQTLPHVKADSSLTSLSPTQPHASCPTDLLHAPLPPLHQPPPPPPLLHTHLSWLHHLPPLILEGIVFGVQIMQIILP